MNSKQNNKEKPLDKIKRTIQHLSQTTEFNVIEIFTDLGYVTIPFTYTDFSPDKRIEVARELDIGAFKPGFFPKNGAEEPSLPLSFIGDVKYYPDKKKRIFVGFSPFSLIEHSPTAILKLTAGLTHFLSLRTIYPLEVIPSIEEISDIKGHDIKGLQWFNFPSCNQLVPFDDMGTLVEEKEKFSLHSYCNQVSSGFIGWKKSGFLPHSVNIPLLVIGSEIEFIVGHPKDIVNDRFKKPKAVFFLFKASKPSKYSLIPILITSMSYLKETILNIEKTAKKVLTNRIQRKIEEG